MPSQTNVALMSFVVTDGTTPRSNAERAADIILNVKDYGAKGDGSDDYAALQYVFDLAHGTSENPHGVTNAVQNKMIFFPQGQYKISQPITLTKVYGGHIAGDGPFTSVISRTVSGAGPIFVANDASFTTIERLGFVDGTIAIDLDWDDSGGGGGNQENYISDVRISGCTVGIRVAHGGYGGVGNLFMNVYLCDNSSAGIALNSSSALSNVVYGGGGYSSIADSAIYWASGGHFSCFIGICMDSAGESANSWDLIMNSDFPCAIIGGRTNNFRSINMSAGIVAIRGMVVQRSNLVNITGGKCLIDGCICSTNPVITGNGGSLYLRANLFPTGFHSTFSGTVVNEV